MCAACAFPTAPEAFFRMIKRNHLPTSVALLIGLLMSLTLTAGYMPSAAAQTAPPPAVTVVPVPIKDVAPVHSFIGRVVAIQSVQIQPRVTAFIDSVPVEQGSN